MSLPPCLQWLTLTDYSHSLTPAEIGWVFVTFQLLCSIQTPFYSWRIPLLISLGKKQSCNLPEKLEMSGNKSSPAYWVARAEASDPGSANQRFIQGLSPDLSRWQKWGWHCGSSLPGQLWSTRIQDATCYVNSSCSGNNSIFPSPACWWYVGPGSGHWAFFWFFLPNLQAWLWRPPADSVSYPISIQ